MKPRWIVLLLILAGLAGVKAWMHRGLGVETDDGNLYYHIARHVAEGDGLVTSLSLYHQGLQSLPAPTTLYPLWPLILGGVGALVSMPIASAVLPPLFYLAVLIALDVLMRRLAPEVTFGPFDAGHSAVLLFGLNPIFFRYTSAPYAEGLSLLLMILGLLAFDRQSARFAALAGLCAGAAYLSRYHLLIFVIALLAGYVAGKRRKEGAMFASFALPIIALSLLHRAFIAGHFRLSFLWDFFYLETPGLPSARYMVPVGGPLELLVDRAKGVLVAFDWSNPYSYFASFGAAVFLLLLAIFAVPEGLWKRPLLLEIACSGALMLLPVHAVHALYFGEWLFNTRQGLYLIFPLVTALAVLLQSSRRLLRVAALALVVVSAVWGAGRIHALGVSGWPKPPGSDVKALVAWLDSHPSPATVLSTNPQMLGTMSRANFHWMGCHEPGSHTATVLRLLPIDYVAILPQDSRCDCWTEIDRTPPVWREGNVQVFRSVHLRASSPQPIPPISASAGTAVSR